MIAFDVMGLLSIWCNLLSFFSSLQHQRNPRLGISSPLLTRPTRVGEILPPTPFSRAPPEHVLTNSPALPPDADLGAAMRREGARSVRFAKSAGGGPGGASARGGSAKSVSGKSVGAKSAGGRSDASRGGASSVGSGREGGRAAKKGPAKHSGDRCGLGD